MKRIFLLIAALIFIFRCNKGGGDAGTAKLGVELHYVDSSGNDLFSPQSDGQNGYWIDSVRVRDLKSKSLLTCFTNGYEFQVESGFVMHTCPNPNIVNQYTSTLIHVKTGMDDTLKVYLDQSSYTQSANIDSIWYNGVFKHYGSTAAITITK
jgi:hypothetical protein